MRKIEFKTACNELKTIVIAEISGGGGLWHLYVDNFYQGIVFRRANTWVFEPQTVGNWQMDDMQAICQLVAEEESKRV